MLSLYVPSKKKHDLVMRVCVNTFTALPLLHRRAEASYFSLVLEGGVFLKMSEYSEISIF